VNAVVNVIVIVNAIVIVPAPVVCVRLLLSLSPAHGSSTSYSVESGFPEMH